MKRILLSLLFLTTIVQAKTPQDVLVMAWDMDELVTLDPAASFEFCSNELIYNMYQRLLTHDTHDSAAYVPEIAESWTVQDEGKRHVFKIKKGLKFASGNPVTAQDVIFSFQRLILLNKSPSNIFKEFGWNKDNIAHMVFAPADDEVHLHLEKPLAPTLVYTILSSANCSIVDQKELLAKDPQDFGNRWLTQHSAGSGPYKLDKWTSQQLVVLLANPYYTPRPSIAKIVMKDVREASTQELLLRKGDVDIAKNLSLSTIELIPTATPYSLETANLKVMHLNQKNKYLQNPKVRDAITHLIDYDGIAKNIKRGSMVPHNSFVPSHFPFSIKGQQFSFDPEKAKLLLKEAGYPQGFSVSLSTVDSELAQKLKNDFAQAGINLQIHLGDSKQVLTKIRQRTHEMALATWGSDYFDPDANASTFLRNPDNQDTSTEKTLAWRNAWDIPDITQQTDAAKGMQDTTQRHQAYQTLQKVFFANAPLIVISQQNKILGVQQNVEGISMIPSLSTILYANIIKK